MAVDVTFSDEQLLEIYEETDTTLLDILPHAVKEAYAKVPQEIRVMEDIDLLKAMLDTQGQTPPKDKRKDIRVKHALWNEYDRAMEEKRKMRSLNIVNGIMPSPHFIKYLENKYRLEWVMRPPLNYWNEQRVLLEKSTMGLHEILDIPVIRHICRCLHFCQCARKNGRWQKDTKIAEVECRCTVKCICPPTYDVKIAAVKHKIHEMIEMRVKGAILQRVRIDKQHLIAQVRADKLGKDEEQKEVVPELPTTSIGIDEELLKLRSEVKQLKGGRRQDVIVDLTTEADIEDTELTT